MKKLKKILFNNGSLTFLSIVSLILVFALVCFLVLNGIYRAGFIENPFGFGSAQTTQAVFLPSADEENREPHYEEIDSKENLKKLLTSFPYYEDLYAEFYITYVYESYNVEFYRAYKNGDRYRIESYDMQNNRTQLIICDGKNVSVTNAEGHVKIYSVSEEFSFANQVSLPSFLLYEKSGYVLSEYRINGADYIVKCDFPELCTSDVVHIDVETGALKSARTYLGEKVIMFYDVIEFEAEYAFENDIFSF
ncbi:MAG: hypothetical protein J6D11_03050 [Clostridia bacterium]|nr:hypothetical protein [Clostridia bacterium]